MSEAPAYGSPNYDANEHDKWDIKDAVCYGDGMTFVMPSGNEYQVVGAERNSQYHMEDSHKYGGFSVYHIAGFHDEDEVKWVVEKCGADVDYGHYVDGVFYSHYGFED